MRQPSQPHRDLARRLAFRLVFRPAPCRRCVGRDAMQTGQPFGGDDDHELSHHSL